MNKTTSSSAPDAEKNTVCLYADLDSNIEKLRSDFGNSSDLNINLIKQVNTNLSLAVVYLIEMVDTKTLNAISDELTKQTSEHTKIKREQSFEILMNQITNIRATKNGSDFTALYKELLAGNTAFILDGYGRFVSVSTSSDEGRSISEPTSQTIIKGPKDAFTEDIDKNVYLIRKRIRNEALRVEDLSLGTITHTRVRMIYINGIAKGDIVADIRNRLTQIDYDSVLDSGYIEELLKSDPYSIFPSILNSEKPDAVTAALLEGKVAILVDGTPYVLTAPALFIDFIQASDDYYENYYISSLMRLIRYIALVSTLLVPAIYIALTTFHQEIIPTPLLISIAAQREGVPFPVLLEVLLMDLTFEILREAGVRMPRAIGSAISIVGALVLGQAAVEAGIVAAATVIVVALTAISSFAITNYAMSNAIRFLRFSFIFLGGMLGLYGISMGLIIMVLHLCKIKSAGVPYLSPVAPLVPGSNKDTIFRYPLWKLKYRPAGISAARTARTKGKSSMDPNVIGKSEL
jgi:spore germination protein KA